MSAQNTAGRCRQDGRCQYAIDHGAEGLAACRVGQCCMPKSYAAHQGKKIVSKPFADGGTHELQYAVNIPLTDGVIARFMSEDDGKRLAACWNAWIGVSTEDIEATGGVARFKGKPVGELAEARALLSEVFKDVDPETDAQDHLFDRINAFLKGKP